MRPPRLAERLLRLFARSEDVADLRSDLGERFAALAEENGAREARRWYWRQLRGSIRPLLARGWADRRRHGDAAERPTRPQLAAGMASDLRVALRGLARTPGYTGGVFVTLVLGIGGTTAVFSALSAVLLRPLPYREPDRLTAIWTVNTRQALPDGSSASNARDWNERSSSFVDMALYVRPAFTTLTVGEPDRPERVHVGIVSWNFFDVLGTAAVLGRAFVRSDVEAGEPVVLVHEAYWRERYGGSPEVLGARLWVDGEPHRVLGVVPSSVRLPLPETRVWLLQDTRREESDPRSRANDTYVVLGRLRDGVGLEEASRELDGIAAQLAREYPATNEGRGVRLHPLLDEITGDQLPSGLWMLFGAVLVVLLLTGTNAAHLTLARGEARRREIAIRAALGAGRPRLVRQLAVESAVLGVASGVAGVALGQAALAVFAAQAAATVPRLHDIGLDLRVLAISVASTLAVVLGAGLLPALAVSRSDAAEALRLDSRTASPDRRLSQRLLVVVEVALAIALLTPGGLLLRSLQSVLAQDPGFDAEALLLAQLDLPRPRYPEPEQRLQFLQETLERVRVLPGVRGAGIVSDLFIDRFPDQRIWPEGRPRPGPDDPAPRLTTDWVMPGFFEAAGVPLVAGRDVERADLADGAADVAVVNQAMAEAFWPGESPLGKRYTSAAGNERYRTVVGVVPDLRRGAPDEAPYPQAFVPWEPRHIYRAQVVVRTGGEALGLAPALRSAVGEVDPGVPVSGVGTAAARLGASLAQRRLETALLATFAALALAIAAVGLFALLQNAVAGRRREIGIRLSLGAAPAAIRWMVMREAVLLTGLGLAVGLGLAAVGAPLTARLLYGVTPGDPLTLGLVAVLLAATAGVAAWLPLRRATAVQPLDALAEE